VLHLHPEPNAFRDSEKGRRAPVRGVKLPPFKKACPYSPSASVVGCLNCRCPQSHGFRICDTHTHTHTCRHTHTHICTHTHTHTHTNTNTPHTHTHTYTHACMHTRTQAYTHKNTP
jgi:hypothetical protein